MKKTNFKALALMGITGGVALCSSASASEILNNSNINTSQLLAAGCGGGKCGGNFTAYQPHGCGGQQPQNYYNTAPVQGQPVQGQPAQGGCHSAQPPAPQGGSYTAYQPHGCSSQQPQSYYTGSCNAQGAPQGIPQGGCNARPAQGGCNSKPAQGSCGGANPSQGMRQPQARNYSQWEASNKIATATAPNGKASEEAAFISQLTDEGKSIYRGLDPAGKAMANQAISQNQNKSAEEKTAAVKVVAQTMSEKRAKAANASKY